MGQRASAKQKESNRVLPSTGEDIQFLDRKSDKWIDVKVQRIIGEEITMRRGDTGASVITSLDRHNWKYVNIRNVEDISRLALPIDVKQTAMIGASKEFIISTKDGDRLDVKLNNNVEYQGKTYEVISFSGKYRHRTILEYAKNAIIHDSSSKDGWVDNTTNDLYDTVSAMFNVTQEWFQCDLDTVYKDWILVLRNKEDAFAINIDSEPTNQIAAVYPRYIPETEVDLYGVFESEEKVPAPEVPSYDKPINTPETTTGRFDDVKELPIVAYQTMDRSDTAVVKFFSENNLADFQPGAPNEHYCVVIKIFRGRVNDVAWPDVKQYFQNNQELLKPEKRILITVRLQEIPVKVPKSFSDIITDVFTLFLDSDTLIRTDEKLAILDTKHNVQTAQAIVNRIQTCFDSAYN